MSSRAPLIPSVPVVAAQQMPGPRGPRPTSPPQFPKCATDTLASILQTFRQHQGKVPRIKLVDIQVRIDNDVFCLMVDRRATRLITATDQLRLLRILADFFATVDKESPAIRYQLFDVIFLGREGESFLHESRMTVLGKLCVYMVQFGPYSFYADIAQWLNRISSGSGKNYARGFVTDMVNSYMICEEHLNMHEFLLPLREYAAEFTVYFLIFAIQVHEPEQSWAVVFTEWLQDDATPFFAVVKENNFLAKEFASTTFNLIVKFDFKNSLNEDLKKTYHEVVISLYQNWKRFIGSPLNVSILVEAFREFGNMGEEEQNKFIEHLCLANGMKSLPMADMRRILGELSSDVVKLLPPEIIGFINGSK
uniref:P40 n=1 Tax=Steinernema glaseri TaxID=37863 RepID=A0A1I8A4Q0_9BILA